MPEVELQEDNRRLIPNSQDNDNSQNQIIPTTSANNESNVPSAFEIILVDRKSSKNCQLRVPEIYKLLFEGQISQDQIEAMSGDLEDRKNAKLMNGLHFASIGMNPEVLEYVLGNIKNKQSVTIDGYTALHVIVKYGDSDHLQFQKCFEILLANVENLKTDFDNNAPIHHIKHQQCAKAFTSYIKIRDKKEKESYKSKENGEGVGDQKSNKTPGNATDNEAKKEIEKVILNEREIKQTRQKMKAKLIQYLKEKKDEQFIEKLTSITNILHEEKDDITLLQLAVYKKLISDISPLELCRNDPDDSKCLEAIIKNEEVEKHKAIEVWKKVRSRLRLYGDIIEKITSIANILHEDDDDVTLLQLAVYKKLSSEISPLELCRNDADDSKCLEAIINNEEVEKHKAIEVWKKVRSRLRLYGDIIEKITSIANILHEDEDDITLLQLAVYKKLNFAVNALLLKGQDPNQICDNYPITPIELCIEYDVSNCLETIIKSDKVEEWKAIEVWKILCSRLNVDMIKQFINSNKLSKEVLKKKIPNGFFTNMPHDTILTLLENDIIALTDIDQGGTMCVTGIWKSALSKHLNSCKKFVESKEVDQRLSKHENTSTNCFSPCFARTKAVLSKYVNRCITFVQSTTEYPSSPKVVLEMRYEFDYKTLMPTNENNCIPIKMSTIVDDSEAATTATADETTHMLGNNEENLSTIVVDSQQATTTKVAEGRKIPENDDIYSEIGLFIYILEHRPDLHTELLHDVVKYFILMKWHSVQCIFFLMLALQSIWSLTLITSILLDKYNNFLTTMTLFIYFIYYFYKYVCRRKFKKLLILSTILVIFASIAWIQTSKGKGGNILSAASLILTGYKLLKRAGKWPRFSTIFCIFQTVLETFLQYLLFYSILIIPFSISFYVLFKDDEHKNPFMYIFQAIVMLSGELDAGSIPFNENPFIGHAVFLAFEIVIVITLMNLLNGLAVSETKKAQDANELNAIRVQLYYIKNVEWIAAIKLKFLKELINHFTKHLHFFKNSADKKIIVINVGNTTEMKISNTTELNKGFKYSCDRIKLKRHGGTKSNSTDQSCNSCRKKC